MHTYVCAYVCHMIVAWLDNDYCCYCCLLLLMLHSVVCSAYDNNNENNNNDNVKFATAHVLTLIYSKNKTE